MIIFLEMPATAFETFRDMKKLNAFAKEHNIIAWQETYHAEENGDDWWITVQYTDT